MSQLASTPPRETENTAESLYSLYRGRIRDYCLGQLRDRQEAEDAVQSTFLYAFTLLQRGVTPRRPLPWLYTIAHNVCRTRRRANRRRSRLESGVDLDTLNETVGRNDPPREVGNLADSLASLPESQREAFLLREWQGLSYGEIAARLELTESAVEALLFRARRNLAKRLQHVTERVASVAGGVLTLPWVRRLVPYLNSGKAGAAVVVLGAAAAASTLAPVDRPLPQRHSRVAIVAPRSSAPTVPVSDRTVRAKRAVPRAHVVVSKRTAAHASAAIPENNGTTATAASPPTATTEAAAAPTTTVPTAPTTTTTATTAATTTTTTAVAEVSQPVAAAVQTTSDVVQQVVADVQTIVDKAQGVLPALPDPAATPLPVSPPKSIPLQP